MSVLKLCIVQYVACSLFRFRCNHKRQIPLSSMITGLFQVLHILKIAGFPGRMGTLKISEWHYCSNIHSVVRKENTSYRDQRSISELSIKAFYICLFFGGPQNYSTFFFKISYNLFIRWEPFSKCFELVEVYKLYQSLLRWYFFFFWSTCSTFTHIINVFVIIIHYTICSMIISFNLDNFFRKE